MRQKVFYFVVFIGVMGLFTKILAQKYDFNTGTVQGWTMQGAYDESMNGPYSNYFTFSWTSLVNYPTPTAGSGSLLFRTLGGHGITGSSGTYWIMQFNSPDLSAISSWQNTTGVSAKIVDNMTVGSTLYANIIVTVYDKDQAKNRYFYSHQLLNNPLTFSSWFNVSAVWNTVDFDWSSISTFPTNYTVKKITIQIMGAMSGLYEGQVAIDEVVGQKGGTTPSESITVNVPNGGESWYAGTTHYITWSSSNFTSPVKIEYSSDNGYSYTSIISSTANDGSYTWTVPQDFSSQCLVRISDAADGNPSDVSNAAFSITAFIALDVPDGGEDWTAGTTHYIVWHGQGIDNYDVKMEYSTDNGASYTFINYKTNIGTSGSYGWEVPNTPSTQCLMKVTVLLPPAVTDVSSATFTISSSASTNTQTGSKVKVPLSSDVTVTFDNVTTAGNTTLNTKVSGPVPPGGFSIVPSASPVYYDISSNATFTGMAKICIHYDDTGMTLAQESALTLQVYESPSGPWQDITTMINVDKDSICGEVSHFSDFAVMSSSSVTDTQKISLIQGWSWISFNVEPDNLSIENVMQNVSNLVIVVNGDGKFYIPGSVNTIGLIDILEGYKVYVSAEDNLSVPGEQVQMTTPLILKTGWNLVSYLPQQEGNVSGVLNSILPNLVIIKNDEGEFYIPNSVNTLGNLEPNEGYLLYMSQADTLIYPED
ncbi:MAG: hypothetical protein P8078_00740 [bacterium]